MNGNSAGFVISFLVVLLGAPALLIALNIYRAGTPTQMGTSYAHCDFIDSRRALASAKHERGRVLFFGLSNVMTSLRSDVAGQVLGRQVVNMGMNANLTNGVLYEMLEQVLKRDDMLVIVMPYFYFTAENRVDGQLAVVRDYIFDCSPTAYRRLSIGEFFKLSLIQRPSQTLEGVLRKIQSSTGLNLGRKFRPPFPMFDPTTKGAALDGYGDWTLNDESQRPADYRAVVERSSITHLRTLARGFNANGDSVSALRDFLAWARSKGIRLFASWPIFYAHHRDGLDQLTERIGEFYRGNDVPVIGKPEDFLYPIDSFFDSAYHSTIQGAELYTRQLAAEMRPLIVEQAADPL